MENYYVKNLETGKLELYFSKSDYMALGSEIKQKIKSYFLFSRNKNAWISKAKDSVWHPEQIAKSAGLTDNGTTGEKITFAEKEEIRIERAEARAERFEVRAEKTETASTQAYQAAKRIGDFIPFGQPILVGHHSEGRHRRDIQKIDNSMRKSIDLTKKAEYYADRADASQRTANQSELKNPVYLNNRIRENEKSIRALTKSGYNPERLEEVKQKLEYYQKALEAIGGFKFTKETLKDATHIKTRFGWYEIKSLNTKTVSYKEIPREGVLWICKVEYAAIKDAIFKQDIKEEVTEVEILTAPAVEEPETIEEVKEITIIKSEHNLQMDIFGHEKVISKNTKQLSFF